MAKTNACSHGKTWCEWCHGGGTGSPPAEPKPEGKKPEGGK